jgi:hypothetical protein
VDVPAGPLAGFVARLTDPDLLIVIVRMVVLVERLPAHNSRKLRFVEFVGTNNDGLLAGLGHSFSSAWDVHGLL